MLPLCRYEKAVKWGLLLYCVAALHFQHDLGFADNGDYGRSSPWIVSRPQGSNVNVPPPHTEAWRQRFVYYYVPFWKLQPRTALPKTSALLLWLPGVALNYCFFSSQTLYGPALSLLPKLVLVGTLWLLLGWIERTFSRRRLLFFLALGVPYALVITSADYVAYLNTFYQETASFVYAAVFFAALLWSIERPQQRAPLAACFLSLFLLATAKANTVYWPVIGVPAVLAGQYLPARRGRFWAHYATWGLAGSLLVSGLAFFLSRHPQIAAVNAYNSLFVGTLQFSDDPAGALQSLGLEQCPAECVGYSAYFGPGVQNFAAIGGRMSFLNTLRAVVREPLIAPRMFLYAANTMHIASNPYLGRLTHGDPRNAEYAPPRGARDLPPYATWLLPHVWTLAKVHAGPRGLPLLAFFLLLAGVCWVGMRRGGPARSLSILGLTAICACLVDMTVAVVGDGTPELPKHMFLANLMFDFALIASAGAALATWVGGGVAGTDVP